MKKEIEQFLNACDELVDCKFLVAEYKLSKMLKALASTQEVCNLVGECLEQFNRDREFAKTYMEDKLGNFYVEMPTEEYKIIALVFCTLVDIDGKKIDFTDFVMRFFGREENPYEAFTQTMIIPFRNLIAEAFGEENHGSGEDFLEKNDEEEDTIEKQGDKFDLAERIAVQILSELQFLRQDWNVEKVSQIARAIIKTSSMKDEDVSKALVGGLKFYKLKQIRFMVKELFDAFDL